MKAIIVSSKDKLPATAEYVHGDLYFIDDEEVEEIEVEDDEV